MADSGGSNESNEYNEQGEFVPWERLPGDTPTSWHYFTVYRDLGPSRSNAETARRVGVSHSRLSYLARVHDFPQRAQAWDDHCDRNYRAEFSKLQRSVAQSHLQAARVLRCKAFKALEGLTLKQLQANPSVALAILREAVRIEAAQLKTEEPPAKENTDAGQKYFDLMPLPKLIQATEAGLQTLRQQLARERALAHDAEVEPGNDPPQ